MADTPKEYNEARMQGFKKTEEALAAQGRTEITRLSRRMSSGAAKAEEKERARKEAEGDDE